MLGQASSYSAVAAERATHLGKAAADYSEGARSQLAGLHLPDTLANLQVSGAHRQQCRDPSRPSHAMIWPRRVPDVLSRERRPMAAAIWTATHNTRMCPLLTRCHRHAA